MLLPNYKLKKANLSDIDVVIELYDSCFETSYSRGFFENMLEDLNSFWYILITDRTACGFVCGTFIVDETNLISIGVLKEYRRRGFGRLFLKKVIEESVQCNMRSVLLEVSVLNKPAINLYQSMGFTKIGIRKGYYQTAECNIDAEVYRLLL